MYVVVVIVFVSFCTIQNAIDTAFKQTRLKKKMQNPISQAFDRGKNFHTQVGREKTEVTHSQYGFAIIHGWTDPIRFARVVVFGTRNRAVGFRNNKNVSVFYRIF